MKIGREDFEALIKGDKTIAPYIELDPLAGSYSVFGVKTASNPNYMIKAIYEMYEANLNKKLAVKAVRKLFRSVGQGSVGLNNLLKKLGMELKPEEFLMLVFKLQHQQGWGAPFELVSASEKRIVVRTKHTFESQVLKDWNIQVCGLHQGWIEGVLTSVTGKPWYCLEKACHAKGDEYCEFVADQVTPSWKYKAEAVVKGESAITEFIEHKPLEGKISLMDEPVVMMPRFIFTSMTNSLKKTMGEAPASGVNYRAYKDMGKENVEHYRKMSIYFDISRTILDKDLIELHKRFSAFGAPSVSGDKIAYGSHVVNDNFEVVDSIEKELGCKATVFQKIGDKAIRVSTNVILADGKRAVGTEISKVVYDAVITKGQTYYGTADVVGQKMVVAYEPIKNATGAIIGILFVGIPEEKVAELSKGDSHKIKPQTLSDMAFAFYAQMGWFNFVKEEWDEKTKTKTITLSHTVESESFGNTGKNVCFCTAGLLAGIIEGSFGIRVDAKEIKCKSKGDEHCVFTITNK
ncbi:MAG: 4-vinyl reductase [Methanomicrobiales archaeon]|nr:4-vinyl reductase [Methanomicrobiales archaeon]